MTLLDSLRLGLALRRLTRTRKWRLFESHCGDGWVLMTRERALASKGPDTPHYGRTALEAVRKAEASA